ncbi:MAG: selenium-binding family protein [Thioalkalivibrio sp.]|nr:selenium-binding family protein [Thioalkalivibrio sp.]
MTAFPDMVLTMDSVSLTEAGAKELEDAGTSPYLYVWAGAEADDDGDFLAVVDADPISPTYGQAVYPSTERLVGDRIEELANSFSVLAYCSGRRRSTEATEPPRVARSLRLGLGVGGNGRIAFSVPAAHVGCERLRARLLGRFVPFSQRTTP